MFVSAIGVSNVTPEQIREYAKYGTIAVVQQKYSLLDRTCEQNGILDVCADTGNLKTFLFTALMGAFVILVRVSGGVKGFVNYLTEKSQRVKSKRMAMLIGP